MGQQSLGDTVVTPEDRKELAKGLTATAQLMGQTLSGDLLRMLVDDLEPYPLEELRTALQALRRRGGRLTTDAVLQGLPSGDLPAGLAWDRVLAAEPWVKHRTYVLPKASVLAFPFEMWRRGDYIGAKLAFLEAYQASVEARRGEISVALGPDPKERSIGLSKALEAGLITSEESIALSAGNVHMVPRATGLIREPVGAFRLGGSAKKLTGPAKAGDLLRGGE